MNAYIAKIIEKGGQIDRKYDSDIEFQSIFGENNEIVYCCLTELEDMAK